MNSKSKRFNRIRNIVFPLAIGLITFLMIRYQVFYTLDAILCDWVYSDMNGTGDVIKIIAIDEETLAEFGPMTTWSREKCAKLAEVLFQDEENAPAVLAYDINFTGDGYPSSDKALAEACKGHTVVTASNLVYRGTTVYEKDITYFDEMNISTEERPYSMLDAVVDSGFSNALISPDGFVRTGQLFARVSDEIRMSFAGQIYKDYCEQMDLEMNLPARVVNGRMLFSYSGKPGEFQRFSMADVVNGKVDSRIFKDSIVLVGAYAPGLHDSFHTPASRGEDMYGVEINANMVRALMLGKTAADVPYWLQALIAAVIVGLYAFLARQMRMYPALLTLVWVIMLDLGLGHVLSRFGWHITLVYSLITAIGAGVIIFTEKYIYELRAKRELLTGFEKYLAPQVIKKLASEGRYDFHLGVERRQVCVMFIDIRGFTSMSEKLSPDEVAAILNEYLSVVTECIFRHEGMLDKFIGDAAMAVFNAPSDQEDYMYEAVCAAIDIRDSAQSLGERLLEKHGRSVNFGIGLNCGEAVVGNIGCDVRMDYTAIGDTVNVSARLEAMAQESEILISEALYEQLKDRIDAVYKDEVLLKGKAIPVKIYNVTGVKEKSK